MNKIRFKGFTLAEVLITLVVLGIIAAVTVPTLKNYLNDNRYRIPLKKTYAVLADAFDQTLNFSEFVRVSNDDLAKKFIEFFGEFRKHVNIGKMCCVSGNDINDINCFIGQVGYGDNKCFSREILTPDGQGIMASPIHYGTNASIPRASFTLKDGTAVIIGYSISGGSTNNYGINNKLRNKFGEEYGTCNVNGTNNEDVLKSNCKGTFTPNGNTNERYYRVFVDVNGMNNGPNQAGKDVHVFTYTGSDGLIPCGIDGEADSDVDISLRWDFTAKFLEGND